MTTDPLIAPRVLSPSDYRRMPWKNRGGLTTEIVVAPPDANFDAFAWRVSMADVDQSGPFSTLADIDRVLVLTAGNGMRLTGDGTTLDVTQSYELVRFPGEWPLHCALLSGPVRDFNLMVRRGVVRGDVHVVRGDARTIPPADAYLVHAARGAYDCHIAGAAMVGLAVEHSLVVEPFGAGSAPQLALRAQSPDAVALVAAIQWL
jgi:environmental stress-induced protein Ves